MRSMSFALALVSLVAGGCSGEGSGLEVERERGGEQAPARSTAPTGPGQDQARVESPPESPPESPIADPVASVAEDSPAVAPEISAAEARAGEHADPAAPAQAPIEPAGPEPGSPEADAELTELLEESTLTQEEFDRGFRDGGPKLDGDKFVFAPGQEP